MKTRLSKPVSMLAALATLSPSAFAADASKQAQPGHFGDGGVFDQFYTRK